MSLKIIDAHIHLGATPGRMVPDQSVESLVAKMDRLGIEKAISAHCYSLSDRFEEGIAEDAKASAISGGRIFSFFGYNPKRKEESLACIRAHKDDPRCVAIKIHPCGSFVDADDEGYRPCWEIAKELGLPIMSHTWDASAYNPGQKYAVAGKFEKYISEYPDVNFVFGHCGGRYNGIKTAIDIGKRYSNTYFDITGDIWLNGFLEALVDGVSADHIVYGSDHTMIEQRPMLGVVYGSNLSALDKEKILYHTAERIYFGK